MGFRIRNLFVYPLIQQIFVKNVHILVNKTDKKFLPSWNCILVTNMYGMSESDERYGEK